MQPYVEPVEIPRKKLSPILAIVAIILVIACLFLLMPSSRSARLQKAKDKLARDYTDPTEATLRPLFENELILDTKLAKPSAKDRSVLYVFAPTPTKSISAQLINEIAYQQTYSPGDVRAKTGILLAPDPTSTGWTLFAKVWIAKVLEGKSPNEVKNLGVGLATGSSAATLRQLQEIWNKVPVDIQKRTEDILDKNRALAKSFGNTRCFFHDEHGQNYEIPVSSSSSQMLYQFMYDYSEANPQARPKSVEYP